MRRLCIALVVVSSAFPISSPTKSRSTTALQSTVAAHVANLSKRFEELLQPTPVERQLTEACMKNCADAGPQVSQESAMAGLQRDNAMNEVAAQIHSEIDRYIARAVQPSHLARKVLSERLSPIPGSTTDKLPSVFVVQGDPARLIIGYTLFKGTFMGERATSVTVRAYTPQEGTFRLKAATGQDMDGYARLSFVRLHSPVPDEFDALLSGQLTGANGPNNRMRLYRYNGTQFRTLWAQKMHGVVLRSALPMAASPSMVFITTRKSDGMTHTSYLRTESIAFRLEAELLGNSDAVRRHN